MRFTSLFNGTAPSCSWPRGVSSLHSCRSISAIDATFSKTRNVRSIAIWAEGVELKAPSPFDEHPEPGRL